MESRAGGGWAVCPLPGSGVLPSPAASSHLPFISVLIQHAFNKPPEILPARLYLRRADPFCITFTEQPFLLSSSLLGTSHLTAQLQRIPFPSPGKHTLLCWDPLRTLRATALLPPATAVPPPTRPSILASPPNQVDVSQCNAAGGGRRTPRTAQEWPKAPKALLFYSSRTSFKQLVATESLPSWDSPGICKPNATCALLAHSTRHGHISADGTTGGLGVLLCSRYLPPKLLYFLLSFRSTCHIHAQTQSPLVPVLAACLGCSQLTPSNSSDQVCFEQQCLNQPAVCLISMLNYCRKAHSLLPFQV